MPIAVSYTAKRKLVSLLSCVYVKSHTHTHTLFRNKNYLKLNFHSRPITGIGGEVIHCFFFVLCLRFALIVNFNIHQLFRCNCFYFIVFALHRLFEMPALFSPLLDIRSILTRSWYLEHVETSSKYPDMGPDWSSPFT